MGQPPDLGAELGFSPADLADGSGKQDDAVVRLTPIHQKDSDPGVVGQACGKIILVQGVIDKRAWTSSPSTLRPRD